MLAFHSIALEDIVLVWSAIRDYASTWSSCRFEIKMLERFY